MQTAVFEVIDKLLDLLNADATLIANKVLVLDGQPLNRFDDGLTLVIGGAENGDEGRAAFMQQDWANTTVERDEQGSVLCALWVFRGDTTLRTLRGELKANLDAVNAVLRANQAGPAGLAPTVQWWALAEVEQFNQQQSNEGALCGVHFRVSYRARMFL